MRGGGKETKENICGHVTIILKCMHWYMLMVNLIVIGNFKNKGNTI